jgi:hypothetical protein
MNATKWMSQRKIRNIYYISLDPIPSLMSVTRISCRRVSKEPRPLCDEPGASGKHQVVFRDQQHRASGKFRVACLSVLASSAIGLETTGDNKQL